ncbi:MAG: hypothetical protein LBD78_11730, partial [Spirochaetaceae bacterium]|nr:hypothetical protein [Spirochaetaceae bacterium]
MTNREPVIETLVRRNPGKASRAIRLTGVYGSYRSARFWMVSVERPVISLMNSTEAPFARAFLA